MRVYTYRFDADGYLISYEIRLYARGDLQNTAQGTHTTTLTAQIFRTVTELAALFELIIC